MQQVLQGHRPAAPTTGDLVEFGGHWQEGRPLWRRFFLVRDAFASLGPAAVLTVHRSQGSTFGEVFIDADVFWPADGELRRQLVYVAVSRASEAVSLVAGAGSAAERELWSRWLRDDGAAPG